MLNVISLGAGRQSTAMALMAAHGEIIPMPDAAIFADTGGEPQWVYDTVHWLQSHNILPFPVIVTSQGNLSERLLAGDDMARIPFHIAGGGMASRQCSRNYKIRPIRQAVRKLLGVGPRSYIAPGTVSQWIGISRDEFWRVKLNDVKYIVNRWPLIDDLKFSVADCVSWLKSYDYPVPWSSACTYCPYLSDTQRQQIKTHDLAGHEKACQVDDALGTPEAIARFRGRLYVHRARRPLREIDFTAEPSGQLNLFNNECEGICGV